MKMNDLPVPQFLKPLNRRVYDIFWVPFGMCWDLVVGLLIRFLACCHVGFGLAALGWMFMMVFMYFMDALTVDVAFGMAVIAILAGAGITAVLAVLTSF